jgi:hypothetical protein
MNGMRRVGRGGRRRRLRRGRGKDNEEFEGLPKARHRDYGRSSDRKATNTEQATHKNYRTWSQNSADCRESARHEETGKQQHRDLKG